MANEPPKTSSKFITNPSFRRYFIDEIDCFEVHIDRQTFCFTLTLFTQLPGIHDYVFYSINIINIKHHKYVIDLIPISKLFSNLYKCG